MIQKIETSGLEFGMYVVRLDRAWLETPFIFHRFHIDEQQQIEQLREYCDFVYIDPEMSKESANTPKIEQTEDQISNEIKNLEAQGSVEHMANSWANASLGWESKHKAQKAADIGKETVPHHLLTRSGTLTSRELETLRAHPEEGANALRKMGYDNENILQIVRHSHEHYNGSGHPDGLTGEAIPLGSRIIAVADTYAAMISWRPYRDSWERSVALDEIVRGAESGIYDRNIVEALIKVVS